MTRRGWKALAGGVAAAATLAAAIAVVPAVSASAAIAPSAGTSNFYWAAGSSISERTPSGVITSVPVTPAMTNLALDPVTGVLYGTTATSAALYRIAPDGTTMNLGVPAGYTDPVFGSLAFDAQGNLWGINLNGVSVFEVDIATNTVIKSVKPTTGVTGDLAWVNGQLYGGGSALNRVDTATGAVTSVPVAGFGVFTGAAFWSSQGHLYVSGGGGIREVVGFDTSTPTLVTLALIPNPSDGASDPTAPNPFLNAADDDFSSTPVSTVTGGSTATVFSNDTNNGAVLTSTDVTATITNDGGLTDATIGADGTIVIPAGATAGTHTLTYRICRTATGQTAICDIATVRILVTAPAATGTGAGGGSTTLPAASGPTLAATGLDAAPWLIGGGSLVLLGVALLIGLAGARRRRPANLSA